MGLSADSIERLNKWVSDLLNVVDSSNPISIHVESLLVACVADRVIPDSILLYQRLVELLLKLDMPVQPALVIPLRSGQVDLRANAPSDFAEMCRELDEHESPSLYLLSWEPSKQGIVCEEYCMPMQFPIGLHGKEHYVYYREFRYGLAINNNWEFSRSVYVKFFPEKLHVQ